MGVLSLHISSSPLPDKVRCPPNHRQFPSEKQPAHAVSKSSPHAVNPAVDILFHNPSKCIPSPWQNSFCTFLYYESIIPYIGYLYKKFSMPSGFSLSSNLYLKNLSPALFLRQPSAIIRFLLQKGKTNKIPLVSTAVIQITL